MRRNPDVEFDETDMKKLCGILNIGELAKAFRETPGMSIMYTQAIGQALLKPKVKELYRQFLIGLFTQIEESMLAYCPNPYRYNPDGDEDEYLHILEEVVDQAEEIQNFLGRAEEALDAFENGDCIEDYSGVARDWVPQIAEMLRESIDVANEELRNI